MSDEIEAEAVAVVAKACASVPEQRGMAAALVRIAGNAYARLTSHEDAFLLHTRRAREHQVRMGQKRFMR